MFDKYILKEKTISMLLFVFLDVISIQLSSFVGLWIRFDLNIGKIPLFYSHAVLDYLVYYTVVTIVIFFLFHMYSTIWSVAGIREVYYIFFACGVSTLFQIAGMTLLGDKVPRSYFIICFFSLSACVTIVRLSYRIFKTLVPNIKTNSEKRIMIVGAGSSGAIILKELITSNYLEGKVVCFVDDNNNKIGKYLNGIIIAGNTGLISELVNQFNVNEIYIAMPSAPAKNIRNIISVCQRTPCKLKILPGLYQLMNGDVSVSKLRDVQIEDLLGRDSIEVNLDEIMGYVSNKVILITGGGGSIGSELCRQIADRRPKQLIILDIYENNAYAIQLELKVKFPDLNLVVLIGSVRNSHRIESIFEYYKPNIVYHAAAHKHVPLMETSPNEAIKNNVFGTYKTALAASKNNVERFVMISTDKAVNPTNIMGASKRMCEMIIQMLNKHSNTDFVAVRFGNVLGSNGSVIPLFKEQISKGGPVTVTHPDILRYFMTIPEAVSLVLQAGAYAEGGEIFVLDMGDPVKILDLAKNLIKLSGYVPEVDIKIEFSGLRPGEKLFEELLMDEEGMLETPNKLIHIGRPIDFDEKTFKLQLLELNKITNEDSNCIRQKVKKIVPTYTYNINENIESFVDN